MAKVVLYSKDPCPYCVSAKKLLTNKGVSFEEIDLSSNPEELDKVKNQYGYMTVPIIVINGKFIGGYSDLRELEDEGKLDSLLGL